MHGYNTQKDYSNHKELSTDHTQNVTRPSATNLQYAVGDEKCVETNIKQTPPILIIEDCPYIT
jgi:hypothetical protein